jgi:hypothetical protein
MFFQLPTGKTIEITFAQWAAMTDEDIEYLIACGHGEEIESPWAGSSIEHQQTPDPFFTELPDISISAKPQEFSIED